ncbi:MAG: hypothetical protein ABI824_18245 [Acidobacteriota bacterium]
MRNWIVLTAAILTAIPVLVVGQGPPPGQQKGKAANPKQAAPVDLTGYWVPLITEDWLYRMVTPGKTKGAANVDSIPVTQAARAAANSWDPAKDEAAGEQCKAYGAIGLTRLPGRIHIEWQDDDTLKLDFEEGTQTRLLHFNGAPPASGDAGYQGFSLSNWEGGGRGGLAAPGAAKGPATPRNGSLKVVTTHLKPGYLRKNGVPYGANATLTEYFDRLNEPEGQTLLLIKSIVEDPQFLTQPFITSTHFKKEPDGSKWKPGPCVAR